ncbi:hypothetical protein Bpfe_030536, partial [Biomphalaria pfeifferi]
DRKYPARDRLPASLSVPGAIQTAPSCSSASHYPKLGVLLDAIYVTWTPRDAEGIICISDRKEANHGLP